MRGGRVAPDALVVTEPTAPARRRPAEEVDKLLRTELSILESLESLEQDLLRRQAELARLEAQREVVEEDLEEATGRFERLSAELDGARDAVRKRLRAMIQLKRTEPYQVLFASESYATFLRRQRTLDALLGDDKRRVRAYREQLDRWQVERQDLTRRRTNLARTQQTIANTLQELSWDREQKRLLLEAVAERVAFQAKVEQEMTDVDEALVQHVQDLRDEDRKRLWFEESKGRLPMPIWKGELVERFGTRTHKRFGTRTTSRGLAIVPSAWDGKREVGVKSVYWGYVAYAGWVRGLGRTVIIDHTRGYVTLYAHLARIDVAEGDKLKTGQTLGLMGDSGSLDGPRLYFELRRDGQAINPKPWLR